MKTFLILTLLCFSLSRAFTQCELFADAASMDASAFGASDGLVGAAVNNTTYEFISSQWMVRDADLELLIEGPFDLWISTPVSAGNYWVSISATIIDPISQQEITCFYEDMVTVGHPSCMLSDLNTDYVVNTGDLLLFTPAFGCISFCGNADLNADGVVNINDMLLFLTDYGNSCDN